MNLREVNRGDKRTCKSKRQLGEMGAMDYDLRPPDRADPGTEVTNGDHEYAPMYNTMVKAGKHVG